MVIDMRGVKTTAAILWLMARLDRPIYESEIAGLIYLADEAMFSVAGASVTGCEYRREVGAPVCVDDVIEREFARLAQGVLVRIRPGHPAASPRWALADNAGARAHATGVFGDGEDRLLWRGALRRVAARCGALDSLEIARLCRESAAYRRAKTGETIEFAQDDGARLDETNDAGWERDARRRAREFADGGFATADQLFARMRGSWD